MRGRIIVVVGGQFGSEGKGEVAGWLTRRSMRLGIPLVAVRVAGPNAGHTVTPEDGGKVSLRQIPVAAVVHPSCWLVIAAGSEIDLPVLYGEVDLLRQRGVNIVPRLLIDPSATVIETGHVRAEAGLAANGRSTGKGIGAARASRLMRLATTFGSPGDYQNETSRFLRDQLASGADVLIEGTQGYGLGLHTPYYPLTTSSDCRAIDFMAMAGVSPWTLGVREVEVWVTVRNRAIRIAGDSGPLDGETSWETLGVDPEYTTVTRKVRRVGGFMPELVQRAIEANGGPAPNVRVALTHLDHEQFDDEEAKEAWITAREQEIRSPIHLTSDGPGRFTSRHRTDRAMISDDGFRATSMP